MIIHRCAGERNPPKVFRAHLPQTLDLSSVVGKRHGWLHYAQWVVSAVVMYRFTHRDSDANTYVPLDTTLIERHVPKNVRRPLLDILLDKGVLECDGKYQFFLGKPEHGKCYCYRIGERYRDDPIRPHTVTHPELLKKLEAARRKEREAVTEPLHVTLRGWHDRVEVVPDAPYGEHPSLDALIDGERRFVVDPYGRVHTNITNLPRQYRQYIRLAGQDVASVDVSTSQPLLLALLITGRMGGRKKTNEGKGGREDERVLFSISSDSSLSVFLGDCLSGRVYNRISEMTKTPDGFRYSRDDVKGLFLAVIYGRADHMWTSVGRAIHKLYPAVFDAVQRLNLEHGVGWLPCRMQRVESDVTIGRVAARLVREFPEMPLLTQHDSILVPPEYAERVKAVVEEEWFDEFGVRPNLKVTDWTAPQAPRPKRQRPKKVKGAT